MTTNRPNLDYTLEEIPTTQERLDDMDLNELFELADKIGNKYQSDEELQWFLNEWKELTLALMG